MLNISIKKNTEYCYKILSNNIEIISEIIHIGDIHIRLSTRHDEYNIVFNKLYKDLIEMKQDNKSRLIYIAGDLFHTKNELQPDTVVFAWNFLKNLSDIYPVIIIMGNHDTLETNNDKTDTITSILKDRPLNNIHYLLNSGVYIYNNIIFGVSSILDNKITNIDILDNILQENNFKIEKHKKIGLFHGQVGTLYLNDKPEEGYAGYKLRGEINLDDFGKYDYIMLGDIHKFQYLDKNKTVAYCSSLISQNFSETDDYHGYIRWDIINGISNYYKIRNDYAFHKINIKELINNNDYNVSTELIINKLENIKSGNLKITYDEILEKNINRDIIKNQINKIYPKISITWQITLEKMDIKNKLIENTEIGLTGIQINTLIKKYLNITYPNIENEKISEIIDYYNNIITETDNIMEYETSDWKLIWLSFDNMYSYGCNNIIDFTLYPFNEIIPIFGKNNIGKSSLIDIITFMLYSRSARDESSTNPKDIININNNKAIGILVIESNNIKYYIERKCSRVNNKNGKQTMKCLLNLFKMIETEYDNKKFILHGKSYDLIKLNGEDRNMTDKEISKIVGTYENFINTSVLLQGNNKTFKDKTNIEKKELLSSILKIDQYFKNTENTISEKYKNLKMQYHTINKMIENVSNIPLTTLNHELDDINIKIPELETITKNINKDIEEKYNKITKLSQEMYINKNLKIESENEYLRENIKIDKKKQEIIDNGRNNKKLEENNDTIKRNIDKLELIKRKEDIIKIYKENINNRTKKQQDIINEITELNDIRQEKQLIKINNTFNIENQTLLLDKLKKFNYDININICQKKMNEIENKIRSLDLLDKKDEIIKDNEKYIIEIGLEKSKIMNEISKLKIKYQTKQYIKIDNEKDNNLLEMKQRELQDLLREINNKNILKILNNKEEIIKNYNKLMTSKEELLKDTIELLKNTILNSNDKNKMIDYIEIISDTIKILFNNNNNNNDNNNNNESDNSDNEKEHIIKNIYNDMLILEREYNKKLQKQFEINNEIENININLENIKKNIIIENEKYDIEILINELEYELDNLNIIKLQIPEYILLLEQQQKEIEYNKELLNIKNKYEIEILNKENKLQEIDKIQDNINILLSNDKILKEIKILDDKKNNLQNKLLEINKETESDIEYKQLLIEQEINEKYINAIRDNEKRISKLDMENDVIKRDIQELEYDIELYKKNKDKLINNIRIEKEIKEIREEIKNKEQEIQEINKEIIINSSNKTILQENIKNIIKYNNELEKIKYEYDIYTILIKMTGRDGLQLFLLKESLDLINSRVNNMLEPFLHKKINMKLNDEMIELSIITPENKIIHTISGTESFFIDLVFKITIGLVSLIPKSNIIFMDESISVLDQDRITNINDLFLFLKNYYSQVFLITHMNQIKNNINYSLQIKKNNDNTSCVSNI